MIKRPGRPHFRHGPAVKGHVRIASAVLLMTVLTAVTACGQLTPPGPAGAPDSSGAPDASSSSGASHSPDAVDLSISLTEAPGAPVHHFRLLAEGTTVSGGSTLPDPAAALAAVRLHGTDIFFPVPGPPRACTQQYGGPQVAVVTGWFGGRAVHSTFTRTDGCEIARWQALAPLLGALAGGTGAV
ncbi:putative small lipoprotein YifL [Arthrobacter silviterrae]|uniref:hypothetical protein n=1 Tax=Arthrobacter TaxID=1663 RepID=UPI00278A588F|nr:putative small lipoprotein YifL [Arthrobacter silviterrae]